MSENSKFDPKVVETLRLEVHPSVVFKLGADLITDDMQALIELIKNSYDADATRVRVVIDTHTAFDRATGEVRDDLPFPVSDSASGEEVGQESDPADDLRTASGDLANDGQADPYLLGSITIVDDGVGMDMDRIRRGWLTVSLSEKHAMKAKGETTKKKRTPLGDKGLGRLGAQRLGDQMIMTTVRRSEDDGPAAHPLQVTMNWSEFADADSLNLVPIEVHELPSGEARRGTRLEIRGLREPSFWRQHETNDLQRELAAMISPYEGVAGFRMSLSIDSEPINLREKAQEVLLAAPVAYNFGFDGHVMKVHGSFTAGFLRPHQGREDIAAYEQLIGRDNGFAFSEWLLARPGKTRGRPFGVVSGDDKHFLKSEAVLELANLKEVEFEGNSPISPGPFKGEVSGIPLTRDTTSVFDKASDYKEFVRALVGIKVYRDGFGVRVDDDWLGLGAQWTSGGSFYSLRPGNVTGYVSISAKDNAALEETTNREAFRDTPAYRNFLRIMKAWADYAALVQEHLRRGYNDYRRELLAESIDVTPRITPESLIKEVNRQINEGSDLTHQAAEARRSLENIEAAASALESERQNNGNTVFHDPALTAALDRTVGQVRRSVSEAQSMMVHLDELVETQQRLKAGVDLLEQQLQLAQEQIGDAWESVALGLSAEALSHEVQHISDGLRGRSAQITQYLKSINSEDQRVWTYVEHVRSSASALGKQVARVTPSLRYMRERRTEVAMSDVVQNLLDYYSARWGKNGLRIEVDLVHDFKIRVNEGKLTQVFDNLVLNSEYWLLQQLAAKRIDQGLISISIDAPFVTVEDNGIGIDESIEELAFDPFITTKPAQNGRGLGLFVVRQLLDSMSSTIVLSPDRNLNGRRFRFRMNFGGNQSVELGHDK
ncbi:MULTISPECIES: sensor histidine kinase [Arthrobacter]|uniref:histidine kinase n=2 Tax=Arthrobacter TaxID=1663 RepID=A0ABU9KNQ5_9MICC|nr:sensor histidine kinase [Arthrobacter sp. YJM1]MDP5228548.1 sensor histidine kinase [Arthrobacter sp. YJM1]